MGKLYKETAIAVALLLLLSGCALLNNLIEQYQPQTYTFNYDGEDYSVLLPKLVPLPPADAEVVLQGWWSVHVHHVQYRANEQPHPNLPTASFWFTEELGVFGLVWHTMESDKSVKHTPFLIVKGLPIPASIDEFNAILDELYRRILEPDNSI